MKNSIIIIMLFLLSLSFVSSALDNSTKVNVTQLDAQICLNESLVVMTTLINANFNVIRVNDSIKEAKAVYDSQVILKEKKKAYDFVQIIEKCDKIKAIEDSAFQARDDLDTLIKFYNKSITSKMDASSADKLIAEIIAEIRDERYENVPGLITDAYNEITKIQSSQTTLSIFYSSTARGFKVFVLNNWRVLATLLILLAALFLVYRIKVAIWLTERSIEKLKNQKKTIKELIMQTQKDYFQYGKIPEGEYNIKTKKYAELIRDIDRQVPLLQEELAKLQSTK